MGYIGFVEVNKGQIVYEDEPGSRSWVYGQLSSDADWFAFKEWARDHYAFYQFYNGPGQVFAEEPWFIRSRFSDKVLITHWQGIDC